MVKKLLLIPLLVLVITGLMLSGCPAPVEEPVVEEPTVEEPVAEEPVAEEPVAEEPAAEEPQYGGVFIALTRDGPDSIGDPRVGGSGTRMCQCAAPAVEFLVRPDEQGLPVPWLAKSWEWSADYTSLTFTLQEGVKYHDGTDFNAQSVKECLDMSRAAPINVSLHPITSIDVVGDYEVRLNFETYQDAIFNALWYPGGWMISPTALKTRSEDWLVRHPVGTGPFIFEEWVRDVSLTYVRNDDYWMEGLPYLDGIKFRFMVDMAVALMAFKGGEAHQCEWILPLHAQELKATEPGKYNFGQTVSGVDNIVFSGGNPDSPFHDVRVRKAVCWAMDNEAVIEGIGLGGWKEAHGCVVSGNWAHNPEACEGYGYDVEKAKDLLEQAGYTRGEEAFETRLYFQPETWSEDEMLIWQANLAEIGITVNLEPVGWGMMTSLRTEGHEGMLIGWAGGNIGDHPWGVMQRYYSPGLNYPTIGYEATDYAERLEAVLAETDFDTKVELSSELQRLMIDEWCWFALRYEMWGTTTWVKGAHNVTMRAVWPLQWHPEDVWLEQSAWIE